MIATLFQISAEQRDQLLAGQICDDWRFNPIQDVNGNWFISSQEIAAANLAVFPFLSSLVASQVTLPNPALPGAES